MIVSELIEKLLELDQDKEIVVWYDQYQKQVPDFELVEDKNQVFYAHIAI